ncbi:6763_t:CDS:2 [Funneliformis geosporum]|nr:6763_t:CDS:2 [Funneliformis geosporum]
MGGVVYNPNEFCQKCNKQLVEKNECDDIKNLNHTLIEYNNSQTESKEVNNQELQAIKSYAESLGKNELSLSDLEKNDNNSQTPKKLNININHEYPKLKGKINFSQYQQLESLNCCSNKLTNIILSANLKELNLSKNNFNRDLSFLTPYTNLEVLWLENNKFFGSLEPLKGLIKLTKLNIRNTLITGSLDYLSGMEQLKKLYISDTDINEFQIDKLPRSLKKIRYSTDKRTDCKLTTIVPLLDKYFGKFELINKFIEQQADGGFILKSLNNSQNITLEFLTEIANTKLVDGEYSNVVKCHGISQDPTTKNYLMVMDYIKKGNLRDGLNEIHQQNLVHQDFHSGNILNDGISSYITDLGLSRPVNHQKQTSKIFGVLPYVAPEVLRGEPYTKKADIYSFGIIVYEFLANAYPYPEMNDTELALQVCQGLRPNLDKVPLPQEVKDFIKKKVIFTNSTSFYQQFQEIEAEYNTFSKNTPYQIHTNAIITSKMIDTNQITELLNKSKGINVMTENFDLLTINPLDLVGLNLKDNQEIQTQIEQPPKQ